MGAKAGGGLANLVDGFLDRQRVPQTIADGMFGAPGASPNAAIMRQTMLAENAEKAAQYELQATSVSNFSTICIKGTCR